MMSLRMDASRRSRLGPVVLALASIAAAVVAEPLRLPLVAVLVAATVAARARRSSTVWLWAALVPVGCRLAWDAAVPAPGPSIADCANPFAPVAIARAIEAAVVLAPVAVLGAWLHASPASLGLRPASRWINALCAVAVAALVPLGLLVGPPLARPFFGPVVIETGAAAAIIPALILACSNAALEEVVFRGAVLSWGARAVGANTALVLQAVLFGLTHVGRDFLNPLVALPVLLAVIIGGLIAGLIVRRTGSLILPLAVHVALDVPLYYAFACRLA